MIWSNMFLWIEFVVMKMTLLPVDAKRKQQQTNDDRSKSHTNETVRSMKSPFKKNQKKDPMLVVLATSSTYRLQATT
jgi:hypothetical protein